MRRSNAVYSNKERCIHLVAAIVSLLLCMCFCLRASATPITRYDDVDSTVIDETSESPSGYITPKPELTEEEIKVQEFNGRFLDTSIYIIGILAGTMMILQLAIFCLVRVYPSFNKHIEKLRKIGIDGYEEGYIIPVVKILLLGGLAYICLFGYLKQWIIYILGVFSLINK